MTRQDFQLIAEVVQTIEDKYVRQETALNFAHRLKKSTMDATTYHSFDVTRFINACDPSPAPEREIIVGRPTHLVDKEAGKTVVAVSVPV